ncbi:solute carrier family 43 member 3-like isoform X2 [Esox lucius]|uniref:solute carrier family 43 member 3-like isoform X2 n=1 Tax=Esox lucius TaxID=8010 RepID=UPI0009732F0C|nr:solute carrier family 43 member 3-like isoform X2 [Esox lucius]
MLRCKGRARLRHSLTLASGLVENLCFSGIAYGWVSLVFVLKTDGYFSDLCNITVNSTKSGDIIMLSDGQPGNDIILYDCSGQDEQFSMVFTVASFCMNVVRFPLGYVFDRYGTLATRILAICLYTTGTLLIAVSCQEHSALLFPAISCLITSGMLFYMTNVQVGNLFDRHRSTVIAVYAGAFDSSAAVLLIVKVLYERGVSLHASFLVLANCSFIHVFRTLFLMPKTHIPYRLPDAYTYGVRCCGRRGNSGEERREEVGGVSMAQPRAKYMNSTESNEAEDTMFQGRTGPSRPDHTEPVVSFRSCVLSWFFLWHLVWVIVMQFCHFLFIATVNPVLNQLANRDQTLVSHYTNAFAFTQLCGVLCAPWNGLILDRHKGKPLAPGETNREADLRSSSLSLFLTSLQCLLFYVCFSTPLLPLQYLTFTLQVLNSAFIYGGHQAFLTIAFPSCHFGKLSGLMTSLSALVLLLQFPVLRLIKGLLRGDPFHANVCLTVLTLLTFIHPLHVYLHCRSLANQRRARAKQEVVSQMAHYSL